MFFFHLENSERFVLYCLCGCFVGIAIILLTIIIILYLDKRKTIEKTDYQTPRSDLDYNDILSGTHSILPIYRYDGRTHHEFYHA
jgi:hypothetical protein